MATTGSACLMCCGQAPETQTPEYILRTQVFSVSSDEFSEELDLKRAAYPYNIKDYPTEYNEMVIHLVKMLSEELVLLSAASEKGVRVTREEADAAEAEFKKDYPDDAFDEMLLKNAISYSFWRKRFEKNMIVSRLIDQELKDKVEVSFEEILGYYRTHKPGPRQAPDQKQPVKAAGSKEDQLVASLRMQKTQTLYETWIQSLTDKYPVEIDKAKLKSFLVGIE